MVSIIIVNYNTKKFIIPCIESIEKYAPEGTEVVVVDNNSTDGSVELIQKLKFTNQNYKSKLKIIGNKNNLGYAKAVNQGVKASKGDYIFVLNPDTQVREGALDKMLEFAGNNKNVGIVGPRLFNPDGSLQNSCYHEPNLIAAIKEYFFGIHGKFDKYAPSGNMPEKVDAIVGAAMFIPRTMVNKVGYFNERYFMYFEDLDFCRKVREAGFDIFYLPSAQVVHEHGGVTRTLGDTARHWLVNSSKIYHGIIKHNLLSLVLWSGQKWGKIFGARN